MHPQGGGWNQSHQLSQNLGGGGWGGGGGYGQHGTRGGVRWGLDLAFQGSIPSQSIPGIPQQT